MGNNQAIAATVPRPKIDPQAVGDIDIKQEASKEEPKQEAPKQEPTPKQEAPKTEPNPKQEAPKQEPAPKQEAPKPAPKQEAPKPAPKQEAPKPAPAPKKQTFSEIIQRNSVTIGGCHLLKRIGIVCPPGYREKLEAVRKSIEVEDLYNEMPYLLLVYLTRTECLKKNLKSHWHFAFESYNMKGTSLAFYLLVNPDKKSSSFKFKGDFNEALEVYTEDFPLYMKMGNWQELVVNSENTKTMHLRYIMPPFKSNGEQYNEHRKALKAYKKGKLDDDDSDISTIKYSDPAHTVFNMFCNNARDRDKKGCEARNTCEVADEYDNFFEIIELTITPIEKEGFCGCMHAESHPCIAVVLAIIIVIGLIYILFNLCDCPFSLDSFLSANDYSYRY